MTRKIPYADQPAVAHPPKIIGEPVEEMCDQCNDEPAEYRVLTWGCQAGSLKGTPGSGSMVEDLCGTCLLREQHLALLTVLESYNEDIRESSRNDQETRS